MGNTQGSKENYSALFNNLNEIWQLWLDATMEIWRQAAGKGGPQAALAAQWLKMMEQAQAKLQAGEVLPIDPFTLFAIGITPQVRSGLKASRAHLAQKFLAVQLSTHGELYQHNARFSTGQRSILRKLQLPTLSDISYVAELVVALEEKVDKIDDRFEDVEQALGTVASSTMVTELQEQLNLMVTTEAFDKLTTRWCNWQT